MKVASYIVAVFMMAFAAAQNTGLDCSADYSVCDRDSECCGYAHPYQNTDANAAIYNSVQTDNTQKRLCNRKDRTEI